MDTGVDSGVSTPTPESNLLRHVQRCVVASDQTKRQGSITDFCQIQPTDPTVGKNETTPQNLRTLIVKWVTCRNRPFTIVEDEEFLDIAGVSRNSKEIPGRRTVARDVLKAHSHLKNVMTRKLQASVLQMFLSNRTNISCITLSNTYLNSGCLHKSNLYEYAF